MNLSRKLAALLSSSNRNKNLVLEPISGIRSWRCSRSYSSIQSKPPQPTEYKVPSVNEAETKNGVEESLKSREHTNVVTDLPRPTEIPWQVKVANSVHLIGTIGLPVQLEMLPDGKYGAVTVLVHDQNPKCPRFWIPLFFEGDMAQVAACHLKQNDLVYVNGNLSREPPPFATSGSQTDIQVIVHNVCFVKRILPVENSKADSKNMMVEDPWQDLVSHPGNWCDFRMDKTNGIKSSKHPDFKHRETMLPLWLDSAPKVVLPKLEELHFAEKTKEQISSSVNEVMEHSWQDLVSHPENWCSFLLEKMHGAKGQKFPDFKHKETMQPLWLDSAPKHVLQKLGDLNFGEETVGTPASENEVVEHYWQDLVSHPENWCSFRLEKINGTKGQKFPDFKHRETMQPLWLNSAPKHVLQKLEELNFSEGTVGMLSSENEVVEHYWQDLVSHPENWCDFRSEKMNGTKGQKFPDFKHKETMQPLWLDSAPKHVLQKVEELNFSEETVAMPSSENEAVEHYWQDLVSHPENWCSFLLEKINGTKGQKFPDFKHKETMQPLWLDSAPKHVLQKLGELNFSEETVGMPSSDSEKLWGDLAMNPNNWWDNRLSKVNPNYPDFRHKISGEVLWLRSTTPNWVLPLLPPLKSASKSLEEENIDKMEVCNSDMEKPEN